ncbi:hypothetical protein F9278_04720 [Streptomyces phaeolivaceus]|uniref:Uncharacterized protein n=1 Tax=Streptomyces phaeolivaceus TaxID=2653200 RepID=A0A5P8JXK6_9ACTN|nr:DUF6397 family protein [Streptomyces phaeolivaceus]QFQ95601.1 hypothetical protein F9278_04720 [Streptomyces phaeolivaceus]
MSGNTITHSATHGTTTEPRTPTTPSGVPATAGTTGRTLALSRAARELGLKRSELDLAVLLGCLRTVVDYGGGDRRVARAEIDRLRAEKGFPETLRERVDAVGSADGAEILGVPVSRFMRLARLGVVSPVKFYLNRYRAVVWLYLAAELKEFAADERNAPWLTGRTPEDLRRRLDAGLDLRPRNWRGRRLGFLLRQADDPWKRAAAPASLLDPTQVAEIVQDPYERAHLHHHRPMPADHGPPDSPAARITARIMTADDPDEIAWLRTNLRQSLAEARAHRLAPRPRRKPPASTAAGRPGTPAVAARPAPNTPRGGRRPGKRRPTAGTAPEGRRGLLGWLRRGNP